MKRFSFGNKMRQSLSDITNIQSQEELSNLQEIGYEPSEHVNRLLKVAISSKENVALVKLLKERDKTIELSRYELRNLREGIHKLQVQNWTLAQTNSQFLGEINLARNKVKALHHEVISKNALLKTKCFEKEKAENTKPRNAQITENVLRMTQEDSPSPEPFVPNRRFIRSKSSRASTTHKFEAEKEKSETKRRQLRRRSARVRSEAQEVTEDNLFEIEDLQLTMPNDICQQDHNSTIASHIRKKEKEDLQTRNQDCKVHRSPVDRLLRRAAERIQGGFF